MGTTKLSFDRFKEGDDFSYSDIQDRFDTLEAQLDGDSTGLLRSTVGEGALNYQHLASSGPLTALADRPDSFGSTIISAHSVRMTPPKKPLYISYRPWLDPSLALRGVPGPGWSRYRREVVGRNASPSTVGGVVMTGTPMILGRSSPLNIKLGSDFAETEPHLYSAGVLIMFNIPCLQANMDGVGFEIQFRDQEGTWNPIFGSDRWIIDPKSSQNIMTHSTPSTGRPVDIRVWLSGSRAVAQDLPGLTAAQKRNLIIKKIRVKFCAVNYHATGGQGDTIFFGPGYLSAISFRANQ